MRPLQVTSIDVGRLRLDIGDAYGLPDGHPEGGIHDIPLFAHHVALPGRSVLVDAPACEFDGDRAVYAVPGYEPPPPLDEQLRALGHDPSVVDTVVITHAHFDHFNALTIRVGDSYDLRFPGATHYLGAADWPESPDDVEARTLGVVREAGRLELVRGERDLGDGLTLLPAPGETPGHQILRVEHDGDEAYFVGDLFHRAFELREPAGGVRWADETESRASKADLVERASRSGANVYFAHISGPHRVHVVDGLSRWSCREAM